MPTNVSFREHDYTNASNIIKAHHNTKVFFTVQPKQQPPRVGLASWVQALEDQQSFKKMYALVTELWEAGSFAISCCS